MSPPEHRAAPAPERPPERAPLTGWRRYAPIVVFQLYLNASLAVFALGPWVWPIERPGRLYTFVLAAHAALLAGYLLGARRPVAGYAGRTPVDRWLRRSVVATLLLYLPTLWWLTDGQPDPIGAILDPGTVYYRFQAMAAEERSTTLTSYVRTVLAPVLAMLLPLTAARWSSLSRGWRLLALVAIASNLSLYVFTGRNKGLVDFVLLLPWAFAIMPPTVRRARSLGRQIAVIALLTAGLVGFGAFYLRNNAGRHGGVDDPFRVRIFGGMDADPANLMIRPLPPVLQAVVLGLSFNQTHGYFALSLALDKPFQSSFPIGHSYILQSLERRLTGSSELGARSYPARLSEEDDWSMTEFWHTTYTWFASDVSFPGTVLVVFGLGYLFARLWVESRAGANPFALGLFLLVVTMLYYLPTNNIVLGQPEGLAGFWGLFLAWRLSRLPAEARTPAARPGLPEVADAAS